MEPLKIRFSPGRRLFDRLPAATLQMLARNGVRFKATPGLPDGFFFLKVDRSCAGLPSIDLLQRDYPAGVDGSLLAEGRWTENRTRVESVGRALSDEAVVAYVRPCLPPHQELTGQLPTLFDMIAWGLEQKLRLLPANVQELRAYGSDLWTGGPAPKTVCIAPGECRVGVANGSRRVPTLSYRDRPLGPDRPGLRLGAMPMYDELLPGASVLYIVEGGEAALRAYLAQNP